MLSKIIVLEIESCMLITLVLPQVILIALIA